MDRLNKSALVVALIDRLRQEGSWCGETHVQKAAYLAQKVTPAPIDFDFVLYRHGPYSFDLSDFLGELRAESFVELEQQYPYGPRIRLAPRSSMLRKNAQALVAEHADHLDTVAKFVGGKGVVRLEKLATAMYFIDQHPDASDERIASMIHEEKPHVTDEEALEAARTIRGWMADMAA